MEDIVYLNGGMHSDNDPSIQPNNTYRYGLNGNLINHGGGKFAFESVASPKVAFSIPTYYSLNNKNKKSLLPIGIISLGNDLIIHSTNEDGDCQIGKATKIDDEGNCNYEVKYHNRALGYKLSNMITGYGLVENDAYHRIYYTDALNQPRTINFANKIFDTYYDVSDLVHGEKYMVLNSESDYGFINNGILYSCGADENIFTYDQFASVSTNGVNGVDYKIIKYLDFNIFNYTPEKQNASIDYFRTTYIPGQGQVKTGVNQYTYQLYTKDGYYSSWSPMSGMIHITDVFHTNDGYQKYQGDKTGANSRKAIMLQINGIDTIFDKIKVGVFESWNSVDGRPNHTIDASYVFYDGDITGESMIVTHIGQENLETLTIDQVSISSSVITKVEDIQTIKQRQILLGITGRQDISDFKPTATFKNKTYRVLTDTTNATSHTFEHNWNNSAGVSSLSLFAYYKVKKKNPNDATIAQYKYAGITYNEGDVFYRDSLLTGTYLTTNTIIKACIRINQYKKVDGSYAYKIIELNDEYFDYKSPLTQKELTGYWGEETYRLGVLFYDKFGVPFDVKYLGDFKTGNHGSYPLTTTVQTSSSITSRNTAINILGIEINDLDITDIVDKIGGVAIVRCRRDKTILAQGILTPTALSSTTSNTRVPTALIDVPPTTVNARDLNQQKNISNQLPQNIFGMLSPELDFNFGTLKDNPPLSGDKLKPIHKLVRYNSGYFNGGYNLPNLYTIWNKYLGTSTLNSYSSSEYEIDWVQTVETGSLVITPDGINFANGFVPSSSVFGKNVGVGGLRHLVKLKKNKPLDTEFALYNYVREKTTNSLYGGTSDAAKANNVYQQTGYYLTINQDVLDNIKNANGRYILNGLHVFGGDCFINLYDRLHVLKNSAFVGQNIYDWTGGSGLDSTSASWSHGIIFPVESEINIALRQGRHFSLYTNFVDTASVNFNTTNPKPEEFIYNAAYSSEKIHIPYTVLPIDFKSVNKFQYMARWSELKVLGQKQDGMRVFLELNYKNADAIHGPITKGIVISDRLFFIQERGVGYFPVEEREMGVTTLGAPIQLGVGGLMNRADNIDRFYGSQHKSSIYIGDNHFGWFDFRRKSMLMMSFNGGIMELTRLMGQESFFNTIFDVIKNKQEGLFNTNNIFEKGFGIFGVFDSKQRMSLMSFKFKDENQKYDFCIAINPDLKCYVGFFTEMPNVGLDHQGILYTDRLSNIENVKLKKYKKGEYAFGTNSDLNNSSEYNYIYKAKKDVDYSLVGGSPGLDLDNWELVGTKGDIIMHWKDNNTHLSPYELEVVFNGAVTKEANDTTSEKAFDNIEVYGNETPFTDVYYSDSKRIASDEKINDGNRNFRYIDNSWWWNVALSNGKERMLDHYLKMKVVAKEVKKKIVYLKTIYRNKK